MRSAAFTTIARPRLAGPHPLRAGAPRSARPSRRALPRTRLSLWRRPRGRARPRPRSRRWSSCRDAPWLVAWLADDPDRLASAIGRSTLELDRRALHGLLTTTRDFYLLTSSPFERYLETPATIVAFGRHYGERIGNPLEELRAAYVDLMCELVGCVNGVADDRVVSDDDLRRRGFDPGPPRTRATRLLVTARTLIVVPTSILRVCPLALTPDHT